MQNAAFKVVSMLQESESKSIKVLEDKYREFTSEMEKCSVELEDLYTLLSGYTNDMQRIIKPINRDKFMRVDRDDIWFNLQQIFSSCGKVQNLRWTCSHANPPYNYGLLMSDEEKAREEQNYKKVKRIWDEVLPKYSKKLDTLKDELDKVRKNKIIPFENKDDEYANKARNLRRKYYQRQAGSLKPTSVEVRSRIKEIPEYSQERTVLNTLETMRSRIAASGEAQFISLSKDEQRFLLYTMNKTVSIDDLKNINESLDAWRLEHGIDTPKGGYIFIDSTLIESIQKAILDGEYKLQEYEGCIPYENKDIDYIKEVGEFRKYVENKPVSMQVDYTKVKLEEIPGYDQEKIILKALDVIGARIDESGDEHILMLDENEQKFLLNLMKLDGGLDDPAYLSNGLDAWRTNHGLDTPENGGPMSVDKALIESIRTDIIKDICKQEEHNEYIAGLLNEMQARYGELLAKAETGEYWNEYKDAQDGNLYGQNVPEIYALENGNPYIQVSRYADNLPVKVKEAGFDYGITKLNVNGMSTEEYVNTMGPIWQLNQEYRTLQDELRDAGMAMVVVNAFMLPLSLTATGEAAMAVKAADIAQGVADAGISLAMGDGAGAAYSIALEILPDAFEYIAPSKPVLKSVMNTIEPIEEGITVSRNAEKIIESAEDIQDLTGIGRTVNKISDNTDVISEAALDENEQRYMRAEGPLKMRFLNCKKYNNMVLFLLLF
jgi:hypothetical protein